MTHNFSNQQKLDAIRREMSYRWRVYPRLVYEKKMTEEKKRHEIAIMEAISLDYQELAERERLL